MKKEKHFYEKQVWSTLMDINLKLKEEVSELQNTLDILVKLNQEKNELIFRLVKLQVRKMKKTPKQINL